MFFLKFTPNFAYFTSSKQICESLGLFLFSILSKPSRISDSSANICSNSGVVPPVMSVRISVRALSLKYAFKNKNNFIIISQKKSYIWCYILCTLCSPIQSWQMRHRMQTAATGIIPYSGHPLEIKLKHEYIVGS